MDQRKSLQTRVKYGIPESLPMEVVRGFFLRVIIRGGSMHLYWRINQDLETLGETLVFHDPGFIRCFKTWFLKHLPALALMEEDFIEKSTKPSRN